MMLATYRVTLGKRSASPVLILPTTIRISQYHVSSNLRREAAPKKDNEKEEKPASDPRIPTEDVDDLLIEDKFALLKSSYNAPKNPIILAHGLMGFDELHLVPGKLIPGIEYWYGITQALAAKNIEVITAAVPPSGSIERRAEKLAETIKLKAGGKAVNIIAYVSKLTTCGNIYTND